MPQTKMAKPTKLPMGYGYGAAAAPYAKKGAGAVYVKGARRRRAARILRKKKASYRAFVKSYLKAHPGSSIADAAKAWTTQEKA